MSNGSEISAIEPDWSREAVEPWNWDPGARLLRAIRNYQRASAATGAWARFARRAAVIEYRFWSAVTGADIPLNCHIEGGLMMPHPNGIVIHPDAVVGPNCLIFQQVTLGEERGLAPIIGGHVDIGAGARIIGGVRIGDHAKIGANAVVLQDVPPGATAVGIPARIIPAGTRAAFSEPARAAQR